MNKLCNNLLHVALAHNIKLVEALKGNEERLWYES